MSDEPTKNMGAQLAQLAGAVELVEVRPLGFLARLLRDVPSMDTPIALGINNAVSATVEGTGQFVVRADFKLAGHPEADAKAEFLKIGYTIISRYRVPAEYPLEQEVLDLFAKTNGMVHLWPYLRAFVSNSCAQMGMMPITLPPFRVQPTSKKPAKKLTPGN